MTLHAPQVGAATSEKRTSPGLDDDEGFLPEFAAETGVCYFNDQTYSVGAFVLSGSELLQCEEGGLWVRKGP